MNDDWTRWDADQVAYYAARLVRDYSENGRLPYPCCGRIREAHKALSEIVAGMDAKMEESNAA